MNWSQLAENASYDKQFGLRVEQKMNLTWHFCRKVWQQCFICVLNSSHRERRHWPQQPGQHLLHELQHPVREQHQAPHGLFHLRETPLRAQQVTIKTGAVLYPFPFRKPGPDASLSCEPTGPTPSGCGATWLSVTATWWWSCGAGRRRTWLRSSCG